MSNVITYGFLLLFAFVRTIFYQNWVVKSILPVAFLQSLLTIWIHISCSYDMSYEIWEVRIMRYKLIVQTCSYVKCNYIWHMDFNFSLPQYGQFPITSGLLMKTLLPAAFYNHCLPFECKYYAFFICHM